MGNAGRSAVFPKLVRERKVVGTGRVVDPAILENPAVYPDDEVKKRIWIPEAVNADYDTARTRAWQTAIAECERFAAAVLAWMESPDPTLIAPI